MDPCRGSSYSWSCETVYLDIDRENVLGSAMNQMGKILGHALRNRSLYVTFKNEPGMYKVWSFRLLLKMFFRYIMDFFWKKGVIKNLRISL